MLGFVRPRCSLLIAFGLASGLVLAGQMAQAAAPKRLDYNRDIRPILSENCFACHGFDEKSRQAELRLDRQESAYADHDGTRALVPGDAAASEAWRRVESTDPDEMMPPPKSTFSLTAEEKAKLRQWIDEGARYAAHWSFIPPVKTAAPEVSQPGWVLSDIDRYVLERLDAEGLKPSTEADRRMFIRRVSQDLLGLPPSADEVQAFVDDQRDGAYERLVDRLLASPHFGERMAIDWLDAARYADTNGFSIDGGRQMWLWRDWVIQAFNSNLPYDRFLLEQLAGDLLPDATPGQRIATGFQRNNMVTHEGGTIPEENLVNYNADRVKTLGESVLGLTLGCAQCHDHKYDPITQRDYYRMFAYFNTVSDVGLDGNGGVDPKPFMQFRSVLQTGDVPQLAAEIKRLQECLVDPDRRQFAAWEAQQHEQLARRGQQLQLLPMEPLKVSTPNRGNGFEIEGAQIHNIEAADMAAYDILLKLPQTDEPITGVRVVFYPDEKAPGGGFGYGPVERRARKTANPRRPALKQPPAGKKTAAKTVAATQTGPEPSPDFKGNFVLTAFSASADAVPGDQVNLNGLLSIRSATANTWQDKYPAEDCLDTRNENGWSPELNRDAPVHLTITFAEPLVMAKTPYLTVQLNFGHGSSLVAARYQLLAMTGTDDGSPLPQDMIETLQTAAADRSQDQTQRLRGYFAAHSAATRPARIALANLEDALAALTDEFPTMVMDVAAIPRPTFILNRGDYMQPRDPVTPGTPAALPPPPADATADRLGLARWMVARGNPLTARVAVNRFWQTLFGTGLVKTSADFGSQGDWPSHPELLDSLAVDFMDSGWDVKALVRKIVLSAAYRQTSATTAALLEHDPQNRLLARGPRFRLPAEWVRDGALKVSGLLVPRLGGPSVNPYSPGDLWREI
ncbi:MAG TPA: PSD1 and planctomycete cytochrome C domain-containing protein, partial [Pirellulales bacterium]|nr:PSD1 and planctomycete cytochrome C domain-containing protein [Pirellulales bacterium]